MTEPDDRLYGDLGSLARPTPGATQDFEDALSRFVTESDSIDREDGLRTLTAAVGTRLQTTAETETVAPGAAVRTIEQCAEASLEATAFGETAKAAVDSDGEISAHLDRPADPLDRLRYDVRLLAGAAQFADDVSPEDTHDQILVVGMLIEEMHDHFGGGAGP